MTWHWRTSKACDLDELLDDLNPQMKDLENDLQNQRPSIMAGYPRAHGAIVNQASVNHTGDLVETTLKTFDFLRGAIGPKGGFRLHASGICQGTAAIKTIKLKWGGETLATISVASGNDRVWSLYVEVWNISTTQEQRYSVLAYDALTLETMTTNTIAVDTL